METTVMINGIEYIPKSELVSKDNMPYVMVRTYSAGVFAGYLKERNGQEVTLVDARRIWYWKGAASLSELATIGTSDPESCKFPIAVPEVLLLQTIEIINISEKAKISIDSVPIWSEND